MSFGVIQGDFGCVVAASAVVLDAVRKASPVFVEQVLRGILRGGVLIACSSLGHVQPFLRVLVNLHWK